jgi:hypothetical protein
VIRPPHGNGRVPREPRRGEPLSARDDRPEQTPDMGRDTGEGNERGVDQASNSDSAQLLRRAIPSLERVVWLDAPGSAPRVAVVVNALRSALDAWESGEFDTTAWEASALEALKSFARMIHVPPETVALTASLAEAAATVALPGCRRTTVRESHAVVARAQVRRPDN